MGRAQAPTPQASLCPPGTSPCAQPNHSSIPSLNQSSAGGPPAQGARLAAGTQYAGSVVRAGGHSATSGRGSRNRAGTSPTGRGWLRNTWGRGRGCIHARPPGDGAGSRPPAPQTPVSGARRTAEQLSGVPTRLVSCRLRWSRILTHLEGRPGLDATLATARVPTASPRFTHFSNRPQCPKLHFQLPLPSPTLLLSSPAT